MKLENNWRNKSMQVLEKLDHGNPDEAPTQMVKRCLQLTKVPLSDFTVEDLRLMIGQNFALEYLVPLAIEKLQVDVLVEGDLYAGDLLENVIKIKPYFWSANNHLYITLKQLIQEHKNKIEDESISVKDFDLISSL